MLLRSPVEEATVGQFYFGVAIRYLFSLGRRQGVQTPRVKVLLTSGWPCLWI